MLFIILTVLISIVLILFVKLSNMEVKYLSDTSGFKLKLKEKDEEIKKLKNKIQFIKNLNIDVEV